MSPKNLKRNVNGQYLLVNVELIRTNRLSYQAIPEFTITMLFEIFDLRFINFVPETW